MSKLGKQADLNTDSCIVGNTQVYIAITYILGNSSGTQDEIHEQQ